LTLFMGTRTSPVQRRQSSSRSILWKAPPTDYIHVVTSGLELSCRWVAGLQESYLDMC
jgi:hypothetical protein